MILHSESRCPEEIIRNLWPYALRVAVTNRNDTPKKHNQGLTPLEAFTGIRLRNNMKNKHPFGFPECVSRKEVQSEFKPGKWTDRSRQGIYLGNSPCHAINVSLVLNPYTGYIIPQFHFIHDESFQTVKGEQGTRKVSKKCQILTGFRGRPYGLS